MEPTTGTTTATYPLPSKKRARQFDFCCEHAAQQALSILMATEVAAQGRDGFVWYFLKRKRTKDQKDLACLLARCCLAKGFVPDTILKDKSDKTGFIDDVSEKIGPLVLGNTDGINQASLPIEGEVVVEDGFVRINVLQQRKLLYVSYEMPATEVMAAIETYVTQQGAKQICFASIVGPQSQQTPSRFSLILLDKKNKIL